ncbi:MAG: hypothetical protein JO154_03315 [Chitinophaga sp.]|uniref:hypothetical protein n=1 Tax=Chitinophaga sp. TaxID=1869181 RepID=UPI0025BDA386|nr:hypothetical protein [Chitinophaga sp.]MBV8251612.1 hypothetical protein [Chitinophaga sp.]
MTQDQVFKAYSDIDIDRHVMKDAIFRCTTWYRGEPIPVPMQPAVLEQISLTDGELPIVLTFINNDNWSLLTTRHVYTFQEKILHPVSNAEIAGVSYSLKCKVSKELYSLETVRRTDGTSIPVFIETGKPSMVMFYGIERSIFRVRWFVRRKEMGLPLVPADGIKGRRDSESL